MNYTSTENNEELELFSKLDEILTKEVDIEILSGLDNELNHIREKSKALASSLNRCFKSAKNSKRYLEVYKLGKTNKEKAVYINEEALEKYLEESLKDFFEKNDFMHYREFVRLLRACTIDVGGETSYKVKVMYKSFFFGKRLTFAYLLGFQGKIL